MPDTTIKRLRLTRLRREKWVKNISSPASASPCVSGSTNAVEAQSSNFKRIRDRRLRDLG